MDISIRRFLLEEEYQIEIEDLLFQLSGKYRKIRLMRNDNSFFIGAFTQDKLIGFVQVFILHKCAFTYALIEDLIVDANFRGQGVGTKILKLIIEEVKRSGVDRINLTVRPERKEAVYMYKQLGFIKQESNVFRLEL